ncbi:hypothetical protein BDY21DRAFT_324299 [Lineolata rhizophorae]|uniref:Inositol polyphosphate-related phosphatase domain-containing protein n=1 Tax=Lineolata rhizophorae TaxID=578093 RepID=A0A6A6NV88_9PEZI|nr:hypothetical protein BDY21DRAFT_324299 [Lineolata rhizophorae]
MMDPPSGEHTDDSSIKPVSALRSKFEKLNTQPPTSPQPPPSRPSSSNAFAGDRHNEPCRSDGRASLDVQRSHGGSPESRPSARTMRSTPSKPRPVSMGPLSPPRSPPRLAVHSPRSPPKSAKSSETRLDIPPSPSHFKVQELSSQAGSRSASPQPGGTGRPFKIPSRSTTPGIEARQGPFFQSPSPINPPSEPQKYVPTENEVPERSPASTGAPPPINRAGKPKIFSAKTTPSINKPSSLSIPIDSAGEQPEAVSPFTTPPSSDESPNAKGLPATKNEVPKSNPAKPKDSYFPPHPTPCSDENPDGRGPSPVMYEAPKPIVGKHRESHFAPPPVHHAVQEKRREQTTGAPSGPSGIHHPPSIPLHQKPPIQSQRPQASSDLPEDRPNLPPRRETMQEEPRKSTSDRPRPPPPFEPPPRRSTDINRSAAIVAETTSRFAPPPKRGQIPAPQDTAAVTRPPPPAAPRSLIRSSSETRREMLASNHYDSDDSEAPLENSAPILTDFPDSSMANRRPPCFRDWERAIHTKYETKLFSICGEYVVSSGYVTRVWNAMTGEVIMNQAHGETVKVTAIAFKPAADADREGETVWLGTNSGEMYELDIPAQSVSVSKLNAHPHRQIIKIYRYAAEMWSLDEDGKLHVWPPDETGVPGLAQTPNSFRLPKGHSASIVLGGYLWLACGKEIRVFYRDVKANTFNPVSTRVLSQPGAGDVTSCALISAEPDNVYFGHNDGKVTIYSRKDYTCLKVVSVSLYKISALVGVGEYLWAGFNTGMIYIYDTKTHPWKAMKDWHAHDNPIADIVVDKTSIWKFDRLQVASIGTDNMIRIWDGLLRDDWLESQMQEIDTEYCDFREVSALVVTWNAGAVKPTKLKNDPRDAEFFRELLLSHSAPDILVFGFQELVDLEDKRVTAKSLFKSSKKKDATEQEHMSHQYRAWRDHLIRTIDEYLPETPYCLLHTANLVGLFTCIFVRESEKAKIREVNAAEVKLGMGGLHGNKGALIVRFILDDSSICFVNCHLAAGQTQTVHRNNDIAAIMETSALPSHPSFSSSFPNVSDVSSSSRADTFVGGGDGSMILDHEICILNGDLNYRIDTMSRTTVIEAVKAGNLPKLLERDQLLLSRKRNPGFRLRAFVEAPITFPPTYKYDVGTDTYDTSDKKRSPAWCDRLLYRGRGRIKQTDYRRHEVRVSDHRPVSGRFKIRVKTISHKRRAIAKEASEQKFEEVKSQIGGDIKLDYLTNVFGLSSREAQRLLKV